MSRQSVRAGTGSREPVLNQTDTDQWRRLAPLALVFLIVNGLQKFIRENLFVFAGAGAGFAFVDWFGARELMLGIVAVLLIVSFSALIFHRRFRFRLEDDAIRVRRGVFEKKELRIRFARIQNIQVGRPFYFRPFGLVRFSLETPGAADKEVELPGIPLELAEHMRDRIAGWQERSEGAGDQDETIADADRQRLFDADTARLFIHGMASNQIWVIIGILAPLSGSMSRRFADGMTDSALAGWISEHVQFPMLLLAGAGLVTIGFLVVLSGVLSVIRFHGFRLDDRGDRLVSTGGLLDQREQTVRRAKITGLTLKQSALGRLMGSWYLIVRQATSSDADPTRERTNFVVPGMRHRDQALTEKLLPGVVVPEVFEGISAGFRRIYWLRWFILFLLVLGVFWIAMGTDHWTLLVAPPVMLLLLAAVHLRWRRWGFSIHGDQLWVRSGLLGQSLDAVDLNMVQQVRLIQSPWQRRHGLANLQLILPQGTVTVPFIDEGVAAGLANRALYAAETALTHRV